MWLVVTQKDRAQAPATAVPLREGTFVIGRHGDCDLILTGSRISRKHVVIERSGTEVAFETCEGASGTLLNGETADKGSLEPGDSLTIVDTVVELTSTPPGSKARARSSRRKKAPARPPAPPPPPKSVSQPQGWEPFQAFLDTLRSAVEPRVLLERLLLGLVDIFKAERGFVLLRQRSSDKLVPVACHRLTDTEEFIAISSTVYNEALETQGTVHIENSFKDSRCAVARSVAVFPSARTIICGPLLAASETIGVIYIDMPLAPSSGTPNRLHLFETVTGLTSQLLAAARTRRKLLAAQDHIETLNTIAWEDQQLVLGDSAESLALRDLLSTAASQDVTVLITGETGTGKEMVARAIHRMSDRRDNPFVPVNCAALPRDILEAELFGAEKGAFTGAQGRRIGRFELASSGTLFLDEIAELPPDVQVKLLRVLQERVITRLGGNESIPLDVRVLCATNADLEQAVQEGRFRRDIYYRVNVFRIQLKPLRERPDDIPVLARHFLEHFSRKFGRAASSFTATATQLLASYPWPGNIRELRNAIERAVLVEMGKTVGTKSLPISATMGPSDALEGAFWDKLPDDYDSARDVFERTFLKRIIERHDGNIRAAARAAGMPRSTVYRRLEKLGLLTKE